MDKMYNACQIKVGDVIPYKCSTGYVINYVVEKVKVDETGKTKVRCRHDNGGANRSFTVDQVRKLIETNGREM